MRKTIPKKKIRYKKDDFCCQRLKKTKQYKYGVHFISPIKLYSLLYLGLLIVKDKLQLGDLLRFIREGHLSFNKYTHLFPNDDGDNLWNIMNNIKNSSFSSDSIRVYTGKLAKFLGVTSFIRIPNCIDLCHRYCQEMNLPGTFTNY